MTSSDWLILILVFLFIVGGLSFLYKSARKFNLSKDQLTRIKKRNEELDKQEKDEE